jgi:hypothetical protein
VAAEEPVDVVIGRAAKYVEGYQRDFAMVVSEERYTQEARYPPAGRGSDLVERTVLRSDFLLVRDDVSGWVPFRDVFERDGMPVRDRDERLSRLFLNDSLGALEQARRIADESARYNVGNLDRNINLPTLALLFLTTAHRERFRFTDDRRDGAARVVAFREVGRPTYVATTGGRDLPVSGRFWIGRDRRSLGARAYGGGLQAARRSLRDPRRRHLLPLPPFPGTHDRGCRALNTL